MYKTFRVRNFRGLRDLKISNLARVNLIAGKNDVGKTALLEALWLHSGPNAPRLTLSVNAFRGLRSAGTLDPFTELFWKYDADQQIEFSASGDWGKRLRALTLSLRELDVTQLSLGSLGTPETEPHEIINLSGKFSKDRIVFEYKDESNVTHQSEGWMNETELRAGITELVLQSKSAGLPNNPVSIFLASRHRASPQEDAERFGNLEVINKHIDVENILKRVDPRLRRLTVISRGNVPVIHAAIDGSNRLLPLPLLGDGMMRLSSLALAIGNARDGMVLVDEIENGLHHSIMESVWIGIAEFASEFNVQVFATTHSRECIRAAHDAFSSDKKYDFRLHRLERVKNTDEIRSVTYDQETLDIALLTELEVR